jgi:hypothetical protein
MKQDVSEPARAVYFPLETRANAHTARNVLNHGLQPNGSLCSTVDDYRYCAANANFIW